MTLISLVLMLNSLLLINSLGQALSRELEVALLLLHRLLIVLRHLNLVATIDAVGHHSHRLGVLHKGAKRVTQAHGPASLQQLLCDIFSFF